MERLAKEKIAKQQQILILRRQLAARFDNMNIDSTIQLPDSEISNGIRERGRQFDSCGLRSTNIFLEIEKNRLIIDRFLNSIYDNNRVKINIGDVVVVMAYKTIRQKPFKNNSDFTDFFVAFSLSFAFCMTEVRFFHIENKNQNDILQPVISHDM